MSKRLQEPSFLVLTALAEGPQHGYRLLTRLDDLSPGPRMRVGTLYAALERLATEGLVEVCGEEVVNGRARRTYRLTESGAQALSSEADRLHRLAAAARERLTGRSRLLRGPSTAQVPS